MMDWYAAIDGAEAGALTSCVRGVDPFKIVSKALDGSVYVQTIGAGTTYISAEVFVQSLDLKDAWDGAAAEGNLVSLYYRGRTYSGYIEGSMTWEAFVPGVSYSGTFKLLVVSEA